jgi:hypothetical protein
MVLQKSFLSLKTPPALPQAARSSFYSIGFVKEPFFYPHFGIKIV